jgi:hypothetical protein
MSQKKPRGFGPGLHSKSGNDLLSRTFARAVPSALKGLTAEFGMGSGVTPPLWSPEDLDQSEELSLTSVFFHRLIDAP